MKGYKLKIAMSTLSKVIITICSTLISFQTFSAEPVPVRENKLVIGAGAMHYSMPYSDMDSITIPIPLFDIQYGPIFAYNHIDEPVLGVELFRHKRVMLALGLIYGYQFLDVSEVRKNKEWLYYGIEDREKATEAALIFNFYSKVGLVDITVVRDVSNTYDDFRSSISWSRPFPDTGNWTIVPRMYGRYYSIKYNDYYYGVSQKEMDAAEDIYNNQGIQISGVPVTFDDYKRIWRPAYNAGNAGQFGVDLSIDYHFTEHFKAQAYIGMEQLAGQVTSSPLINDADIWKVSLGIAADF